MKTSTVSTSKQNDVVYDKTKSSNLRIYKEEKNGGIRAKKTSILVILLPA